MAASLNGGNALAAFVRMIQLWCVELGCSVPQEKIWNTALTAGIRETEVPSLVTSPTILGERHNPDEKGSVTNINQVRMMFIIVMIVVVMMVVMVMTMMMMTMLMLMKMMIMMMILLAQVIQSQYSYSQQYFRRAKHV